MHLKIVHFLLYELHLNPYLKTTRTSTSGVYLLRTYGVFGFSGQLGVQTRLWASSTLRLLSAGVRLTGFHLETSEIGDSGSALDFL